MALSTTGAGVTIVSQPAVAAALKEKAASVLARRSPGPRGLALFHTKQKRAPLAAEHAAGPKPKPPPAFDQTETIPPEEASEAALAAPAAPLGIAVPPETPGALPLEVGSPGPTPAEGGVGIPILSGGGPGIGGPILVSSGPPGGGGGGTAPITITPSPTPEPSAWAMLIIGFFSVGAALRSRRDGTSGLVDGVRS